MACKCHHCAGEFLRGNSRCSYCLRPLKGGTFKAEAALERPKLGIVKPWAELFEEDEPVDNETSSGFHLLDWRHPSVVNVVGVVVCLVLICQIVAERL